MFANVIVDIVHENVAHTFTYSIPEGMDVVPGQRVSFSFGRQEKEGIVLEVTENTDLPMEKIKPLKRTLENYPVILPHMLSLAREMAENAHCPLAETLRLMLPAQMRGERVAAKQVTVLQLTLTQDEIPQAMASQGRSEKRRKIIGALSDGKIHLMSDVKMQVSEPYEAVRQLENAGIVQVFLQEEYRRPLSLTGEKRLEDFTLTDEQQEVFQEILPSVRKGEGKFLLHGVTGSGKTEVFVHLVREILSLGKCAIMLVPEIALTPQMVEYFHSRFGDVAAVMHSRLSAGERYDEWRRIRMGEARVVIGARSAIFSPVQSLGLVIIDEEHESTYQNDHNPRYDTREVAEIRCRNEGASLLMASATPSILSFAKARRGDYTLLELKNRVGMRPMPEVEIVDMRRELSSGNRSIFSGKLISELRQCIQEGNQAMLMMNHRGYNSFVSCRSCGKVIKCPNCDVAMTYHVGGDSMLKCHYCGYCCPVPARCPECGSIYIRYFGAGTQKVEEELHKLFPEVKTVRMDTDTTSGKDGHQKILDEFRSGRAKILVGTQMIAKGLDFPQVTLVGVVAADLSLNLPDYRSRERTFQLLCQVAGRAGRGEKPGHVIIQTYKPEDETILASASQDYRKFFSTEFERRRSGLYPPFTAMARILLEGRQENTVEEAAGQVMDECTAKLNLKPDLKRCVLMMHMDKPGISMLRGLSRRHIVMKLLVRKETDQLVKLMTDIAAVKREGVSVVFEYNPTSMM